MTSSELQVFIEGLPTSNQALEIVENAQQRKQDDDQKNKNYRLAKVLDHLGNKIRMEAKQGGRGIAIDFKVIKMRLTVQDDDIFEALDILGTRGFQFNVNGGCNSALISW